MRNIILWSMLCLSVTVFAHQPTIPASSDGLYRFRLNLTDKNGCEYSLDQPELFLSEKSLQRRQRQGIQLDETDLPIPVHYLKQIKEQGATIHSVSKWANTVLVEVGDSLQGEDLANLPFVSKSTCVWTNPTPKKQLEQKGDSQATRRESVSKDPAVLSEDKYGEAQNQIAMLKADKLHEAGFCGQGLTVAVIDGGFLNADVIPLFDNIEVLGTYNVVSCDRSVYESEAHGTAVLSCIGMNKENIMIGTAPAAKFWLIASEDGASEQPVELDYWAAALEYADSVGVDVVNSSLGYNQFDDKNKDLKFWELDGKSNPASLAASLAANKGIVCVISAGNTGAKTWKKITPPADADHILCVGATDSEGLIAPFSSIGYSADGRVKPDVCAQGGNTVVMGALGTIGRGNGTSFAAPTLCGAVASLWSALPNLTAHQLIDLVRKHGHNYAHPDELYGYGIPDFWQAYLDAQ